MSGPSDWLHFYQPNNPNQVHPNYDHANPGSTMFVDGVSDSTVITTAVTSPTIPTSLGNNTRLSPDQGRVAKPIRRRSRASRRTPTTLLNTDTSNFRAMVQQFTGGPTAPLAAPGSHPVARSNFSFGFGSGHVMVPPGYVHVNQPQQQFMFSLNNMNHSMQPGDQAFYQTHGVHGARPSSTMGISDGFVTESNINFSAQVVPPATAASDSGSSENRGNVNRFRF